ncbi:MAG: DUF1295 domain-containing protein [Hellea sp.]|nr:DUF1295 domain-containing protein [Hellea sp.]
MTDLGAYLGTSALVLILCLVPLWLISLKARDASIIDIFWGFGFVVVACVCLYLAPVKTDYLILLAALPIIWGLRLTLYLAKRNLGHGEDPRYAAMQKRAEKKGISEAAWRRRALYTIFLGQGFLILLVSAPVWIGFARGFFVDQSSVSITTTIGPIALIGTLIWLIGFLFEAIGDWQLARFLKKNKDYDGPYETKPVLNTGLWKYTRHPNYFGNAAMWWGIFLVACQAPLGWVSIFAPLIMTILLTRVSGRDLLERKLKKRPAYKDYVARTSGFFPWFPKKS